MIDIHCHILPGVDDGSPDIETSLSMSIIAAKDGIRSVIATPHIGDNGLTREVIIKKVELLNTALKEEGVDLTIYPGGEIQSYHALSLANNHTLAFGRFILIEFPHLFLPSDSITLIRDLVDRGFRVIVAHIERNHSVIEEPEKVMGLLYAGAEMQVTAESLTGFLGPDQKRCTDYLLRNKWVHYIATDSHSPRFRRPTLSRAVQVASKMIGKKEALKLVMDNPQRIFTS